MRVAIYCRVSSERQEKEHTIGSQLDALRNYAAHNGMEIFDESTAQGSSGAGREFVLQALILEEMEGFGVKSIFLEGGAAGDPLSKFMHQIAGAVAEFERA